MKLAISVIVLSLIGLLGSACVEQMREDQMKPVTRPLVLHRMVLKCGFECASKFTELESEK